MSYTYCNFSLRMYTRVFIMFLIFSRNITPNPLIIKKTKKLMERSNENDMHTQGTVCTLIRGSSLLTTRGVAYCDQPDIHEMMDIKKG